VKRVAGIFCAVAVLSIGGCRALGPVHPPAEVKWERGQWVKTELYFGMGRAGGEISGQEFARFLAEVVTPRFSEGLTVVEARGQWRDGRGRVVSEPTRVVVLMHRESREASGKIEEIRRMYKARFGQESVMRVDDEVKVGF